MRRFRFQGQKRNEPPRPHGLNGSLDRQEQASFGRLAWYKSYLLARFERLELERRFDRDCAVRFVREAVRPRRAVERAVLLRRVEREVLRDAVRRFVPVLRRVVDLRPVLDLRAVDLRPDDRRVVLRDAVLRALDLRPVLLRPEVLRALEDFRPEDLRLAPVLPARSRRFVRR